MFLPISSKFVIDVFIDEYYELIGKQMLFEIILKCKRYLNFVCVILNFRSNSNRLFQEQLCIVISI